ncbi:hypothetical protein GHK30_24920 [Sinorhizobium medicae]|nr:hypothetical protein [Sinorhizobium medicae]MQX49641.1 hypothetical protein [Sinorhizobium medicae]
MRIEETQVGLVAVDDVSAGLAVLHQLVDEIVAEFLGAVDDSHVRAGLLCGLGDRLGIARVCAAVAQGESVVVGKLAIHPLVDLGVVVELHLGERFHDRGVSVGTVFSDALPCRVQVMRHPRDFHRVSHFPLNVAGPVQANRWLHAMLCAPLDEALNVADQLGHELGPVGEVALCLGDTCPVDRGEDLRLTGVNQTPAAVVRIAASFRGHCAEVSAASHLGRCEIHDRRGVFGRLVALDRLSVQTGDNGGRLEDWGARHGSYSPLVELLR